MGKKNVVFVVLFVYADSVMTSSKTMKGNLKSSGR